MVFWSKFKCYWSLSEWLFIPLSMLKWRVCLVCCYVLPLLYRFYFWYGLWDISHRILLHNNKGLIWSLWFEDVENLNVTNIETAQFGIYLWWRVLLSVSSIPFLLTGTLIQHANLYLSINYFFTMQFLKSSHVNDFCSKDFSEL